MDFSRCCACESNFPERADAAAHHKEQSATDREDKQHQAAPIVYASFDGDVAGPVQIFSIDFIHEQAQGNSARASSLGFFPFKVYCHCVRGVFLRVH